jgi:pilus assembly protein CpaF
MVSIVISEKGGAERRERFESPEISIGRVKGNDVLLPKGNVSKRHARLIQRDGRFIVTDLKSTNGTYVNHRRITHATLVREGDRIYIGDFVLWIEDQGAGDSGADASDLGPYPDGDASAMAADGFPSVGASLDSMSSSGSFESSRREGADGVVSHFPIERDPDESAPDHSVPGPPRMPHGLRQGATGSYPALDVSASHDLVSSAPAGSAGAGSAGLDGDSGGAAGLRPSGEPAGPPSIQTEQQQLFDELMTTIVGDLPPDAPLDEPTAPGDELRQQIEGLVERHAASLGAKGPLPGDLSVESLRATALRELLEHGPLGPLLEDDGTSQVQVIDRRVVITRRGRRLAHRGLGFSSEAAVSRALTRLCAAAGSAPTAAESYVERELPNGRRLFAVRPPVSRRGTMLVISKPQRSPVTLNTLVRSGTISRGMASLLGHAIAARTNLFVVGSVGTGVGRIVDALAAAIPAGDRTIWLCEPGATEHVTERIAAIDLGDTEQSRLAAIEAAARLQPDHMLVPPLAGPFLTAVLDAVTRGTEGVIMYGHASTLRHAVGRLSADVAGARPGLTVDTAREWLVSAFDLGLEVARLRDQRQRVARVTEFRVGSKGGSLRDVFTFSYHRTATGGSIEGAFHATGTVPRLVDDLAARGMPLDTSIFRRHLTG